MTEPDPLAALLAAKAVVVADGDTVVIGGLISEVASSLEAKVPFLGDIPILGWLFKSVAVETRRTNLVILLTPALAFYLPLRIRTARSRRRQDFAL